MFLMLTADIPCGDVSVCLAVMVVTIVNAVDGHQPVCTDAIIDVAASCTTALCKCFYYCCYCCYYRIMLC